MAAKDKKEIEVLLEGLDISPKVASSSSRHLATVELIWPRPTLAAKTAVKTLSLHKGVMATTDWEWHKKILFKEDVEYRFGINVKITESLTSAFMDSFFRFFASSLFGIGGDIVEDLIPGPGGNAAAAPLEFARKKLAATKDPEIILEGGVTLLPSQLSDTLDIEIPLRTIKDAYAFTGPVGPKNNIKTKKLLSAAGTMMGRANIRINKLAH